MKKVHKYRQCTEFPFTPLLIFLGTPTPALRSNISWDFGGCYSVCGVVEIYHPTHTPLNPCKF